MRKTVLISCFVFILTALIGCESPFFHAIFQEQEWSENYALHDGVTCTAPEMIDGDLNTAGRIRFPSRVNSRLVYGAYPSAEAEIILPERKAIHKIVIYSENLCFFKLLSCVGKRENWKIIKEVDNNTEKRIVIRMSIVTDKIKIRARGNAIRTASERAIIGDRVTFLHNARPTEPKIQEIELYGFK